MALYAKEYLGNAISMAQNSLYKKNARDIVQYLRSKVVEEELSWVPWYLNVQVLKTNVQ